MQRDELSEAFARLSTPLVCDACLRLGRKFRLAPIEMRPLVSGQKIAGRVLPARHYGSVDIFLEAMLNARQGDVLVIDNGGRTDEACIGDLTALEARASGLAGMVVWGCHRDSKDLMEIGFPVFSLGACLAGPQRLDAAEPEALTTARMTGFVVSKEDTVFADDDGVFFVSNRDVDKVLSAAEAISDSERRQAAAVKNGKKLIEQFEFERYLSKRSSDPTYTFRKHLRGIGGAIEE
jgi:4-hydroxy-4-methyl-2-oxoglutarate aldolase